MGLCPSCNGCTKYQGGLVFSGFSACMLYDCADTCNKYAAWLERKRVRHEKAVALWKEHPTKPCVVSIGVIKRPEAEDCF